LKARFEKELKMLELIMNHNKAAIQQDHISMAISALETTDLIR
jgi:hypothetical protein